MSKLKEKRVVITGIGPISAIGIGKNDLWQAIVDKKQGISQKVYNIDNISYEKYFIYAIDNFDINDYNIDEASLQEILTWKKGEKDIDLNYFLASIKLALDDSKLDYIGRNDFGLVLSHENPGLEDFYSKIFEKSYTLIKENPSLDRKKYFQLLYDAFSSKAYDLQTFMFLYHIAKVFGIHGYSLFINNACSSGLYTIEAASQIIKSGKNKVVIVAAVDNPGVYRHLWLSKQGMCAEDGVIKPFAKDRHGFICGQGGAALVLEDYDYAYQRGANVYAEYLGGGFSLESWKVTFPNVSKNFYRDCIIEALRQSKTKNSEVDLINAHGVATNIIDQYEARAISEVFGYNKQQPLVTAFKPNVGHNLGGCALLELAIALLALQSNMAVAILNHKPVDTKLKLNIVTENISCNMRVLLKTCCGFGGFDAACIFKKVKT